MFNIHIKGKFDNETQLIQGKKLPQNAVRFKEGETVAFAFRVGFIIVLPIILIMIFLSILRCAQIIDMEIDKKLELNIYFVCVIAVNIALLFALIYLHEFIHAIIYPIKAEKTIWKYEKQGAYFVYCDAEITKNRFIILCITPVAVLGIIPFVVWYIIAPFLKAEWIICTVIITWIMTIASVGDFANIYNVIKQVPKNAMVFNYGLHSYWIEKT